MAADALWACAQQSLQNHLYENAIFLAERVVAESTTEASKLLLATCYFQAGASNRAEMVLLGAKAPQNRYLLALCHMRLGKLNEAQHALLGSSSHDAAATAAVPNGAAGLYLLGMICLKSQQRERAVTYFTRCLGLNPFLWSAYEALCQLGAPLPEAVKPGDSLPNCSEPPPSASTAASALPAPCATPLVGWAAASAATPVRPPQLFTPADSASVHASTVPASAGDAEMHSGRPLSTPNLLTPQMQQMHTPTACPPLSGMPSPSGVGRRRANVPASATEDYGSRSTGVGSSIARRGRGVGGFCGVPAPPSCGSAVPVRRSSRLSTSAPPTDVHAMPPPSPRPAPPSAASHAALQLLERLASGYHLLCQYKCRDALAVFHSLPERQKKTGWVLCQLGRAHFEMVQYAEALQAFELALKIEPHRLCGMELHSTILWHLKREVGLSYLAKRALDFERNSPYACCVVGNCFSLQKEHDTALKFFQRAIQLQPDFAYAYTLSGHEYSANDDFEKATACYRSAIRFDERHYNAWYGLGNIYYRQEKYDFAEQHLQAALKINPSSSPLYCYLGMALHANQKPEQALNMLATAIDLDQKNPLARFQKAQVLLSMDQYELALTELKTLVEMAPKEGSVYQMLGKVYKKLGDHSNAMVNLTRAMDLSPKDAQQIKAAINNLEKEDNAEEEEDL